MKRINKTIAVAYLARGRDSNFILKFKHFLHSYIQNHAGYDHSLHVIFKGFLNHANLEIAKNIFREVPHKCVYLSDESFDIGAYIKWASHIEEDLICVLNTASEILTADWLAKLAINLTTPNVALVGATASYESQKPFNKTFPAFPNIHIRSSGFMLDRKLFLKIAEGIQINTKSDALQFESGPKSLTRQVLDRGQKVLLVGRNGRGYPPEFWPISDTFRLGIQKNLLIADNQTRDFSLLPWHEKKTINTRTWGKYIRHDQLLKSK